MRSSDRLLSLSPPAGQFRELALVAGGFVVQTKILKDLHQTLLLTRGLDELAGGCAHAEQLLTGQSHDAVGRCRAQRGVSRQRFLPQFVVAGLLRVGRNERQDDVQRSDRKSVV